MTRPLRWLVAAVVALCVVGAAAASPSWPEQKCSRYQRDWNEALRRFGATGLSPEFIAGNAAFIGSGCAGLAKVCPRTAKDRQLVDILAIRVVNEGMSTTFLPFDCPQSP